MSIRSQWAVAAGAPVALFVAAAALALPAAAQQLCTLPDKVTPFPAKTYPDANPDAPRDYNVLAISWSPDFCHGIRERAKDDSAVLDKYRHQCASANRFEWVVHGLWPQNSHAKTTKEHPRACKYSPSLPAELLRKYLCTLPGEELMQNEWQAHGTCGWSTADAYFADTEQIWRKLARPKVEQTVPAAKQEQDVVTTTAGEVKKAWAAANAGRLRPENLTVSVGKGNYLKEVLLCLSKAYEPIRCPPGGTPDGQRIRARLLAGTGR